MQRLLPPNNPRPQDQFPPHDGCRHISQILPGAIALLFQNIKNESKPSMTMIREHTGPAVLVSHCALFGTRHQPVRWFKVDAASAPYAQYEFSIDIMFIEPRKRRKWIRSINGNISYTTIEINGQTVYDTRSDVPCNMVEWERTKADWLARRAKVEAFQNRQVQQP